MKREEIKDLNGISPNVGDKVALAAGWMTNNAYINIATVEDFVESPKTVKMLLNIEKSGLGGYSDYGYERKTTLVFPSKHCKFLILKNE